MTTWFVYVVDVEVVVADPRPPTRGTFAQTVTGTGALSGTISDPAWKHKPSWYLVTTEDKMIPPAAQRFMAGRAGATVVEEQGSHAIYVSQPKAVAKLIVRAAQGATSMAA